MSDIDRQRTIDQTNIINTLNCFVLSIDSRDWDTMRDCLTDEVDFDYSALGASMPRTADELVEQVRRDQSHFKAVQHVTTNHYVTINGDIAQCRANVRAQHLLLDDQSNTFWILVGRYTYRLVSTQAGWKIHGCTISVYWTETDGTVQRFEYEQSTHK